MFAISGNSRPKGYKELNPVHCTEADIEALNYKDTILKEFQHVSRQLCPIVQSRFVISPTMILATETTYQLRTLWLRLA